MNGRLCIGLDFGTDSVRCAIVDSADGSIISTHVHNYEGWKLGKFCNAELNQFRQHPKDHLASMEEAISEAIYKASIDTTEVVAMCVDTTGSSPLPLDRNGVALAMLPKFERNPNAMMVLWKDHTAIKEADEINALAHDGKNYDFTRFSGGIYSAEWYWSKVLHIARQDQEVKEAAYVWLEHCDWITHIMTGSKEIFKLKASRCASGHKGMWHQSWGGFPESDFLHQLDPYLSDVKSHLFTETFTSDQAAGTLCPEWSKRLGLSENVLISVGLLDAHAEAVGAGVSEGTLVRVMGTSTCDMIVAGEDSLPPTPVSGICGQVDGSIVPGMQGLEAGQSAFGDMLSWFNQLILWPIQNTIGEISWLSDLQISRLQAQMVDLTFKHLNHEAQNIEPGSDLPIALDWINGRRTPDADQTLKAGIINLSLGSTAPHLYRSFVEAICFGSRKIIERFREEGVAIESVIGVGGVAKKSPFVMQTLANVLNMPIKIRASRHTAALGSAMLAAVTAGIYPSVLEAQKKMTSRFEEEYYPQKKQAELYNTIYSKYLELASFVESKSSTF